MLAALFERAHADQRCAFIPYVMAGDPDLATTQAVIEGLSRAGADAIELGIPYGDPLADGPTIAAAGIRALDAGTRIADVIELAGRAIAARSAPIVLFTYVNPVLQYGIDRFARDVAQAGVAGVIVPDVALEEAAPIQAALRVHGVAMPLLVAPSTPLDRAATIAAHASGFVYVVSRLGVTGAGTAPNFSPLIDQLRSLRGVCDKPLAIGFGVSTAEHVRAIAPHADGIIVGSALIDAYAGKNGTAAATAAVAFAQPLIAAAKQA